MVDEHTIRELALALPDATEKPSYGGRPSWRTPARMFAWLREAPDALVVWVDSDEDKHALIASDPAKFFTTDHYEGQAVVLVNLGAVDRTKAAELLTESWRHRASTTQVATFDAADLTGDAGTSGTTD